MAANHRVYRLLDHGPCWLGLPVVQSFYCIIAALGGLFVFKFFAGWIGGGFWLFLVAMGWLVLRIVFSRDPTVIPMLMLKFGGKVKFSNHSTSYRCGTQEFTVEGEE
jgi:hypothetical protein